MIKTLAKQIKEYKSASLVTPIFMILEVAMEMAVSYTHLDVYKRQLFINSVNPPVPGSELHLPAPVSLLLRGIFPRGDRYGGGV